MNNIEIFKNPAFGDIRTVLIESQPWFVGKDVAAALGYSNPQKAVRDHVDSEDRGVNEMGTPSGTQDVVVINESGLYSLVLSSKLPSAKQFKHWITAEVLPTIRKHGMYAAPETVEKMLQDPDVMIRTLEELKKEREARKAMEAQAEENRPKVLFADAVAASSSSVLVGDLAKLIRQNGVDIGQNRLFSWMRNNGYLIKGGARKNMPTQKSLDLGLCEIKESVVSNPDGSSLVRRTTKITGKGQQYFVNKFLGEKR